MLRSIIVCAILIIGSTHAFAQTSEGTIVLKGDFPSSGSNESYGLNTIFQISSKKIKYTLPGYFDQWIPFDGRPVNTTFLVPSTCRKNGRETTINLPETRIFSASRSGDTFTVNMWQGWRHERNACGKGGPSSHDLKEKFVVTVKQGRCSFTFFTSTKKLGDQLDTKITSNKVAGNCRAKDLY